MKGGSHRLGEFYNQCTQSAQIIRSLLNFASTGENLGPEKSWAYLVFLFLTLYSPILKRYLKIIPLINTILF